MVGCLGPSPHRLPSAPLALISWQLIIGRSRNFGIFFFFLFSLDLLMNWVWMIDFKLLFSAWAPYCLVQESHPPLDLKWVYLK